MVVKGCFGSARSRTFWFMVKRTMLQPETSLSDGQQINVTETFPISVGYFNKGKVQSTLSYRSVIHGYVRKGVRFWLEFYLWFSQKEPRQTGDKDLGEISKAATQKMGKQHLDLQWEAELHPWERRRSPLFLEVTKTDAHNLETWRHTEVEEESFFAFIVLFLSVINTC